MKKKNIFSKIFNFRLFNKIFEVKKSYFSLLETSSGGFSILPVLYYVKKVKSYKTTILSTGTILRLLAIYITT